MTSHSDSELATHTQQSSKIKFKAKDKIKATEVVNSTLIKAIKAIQITRHEQTLLKLVAVNNLEGVQGLLETGTSANCHDQLNRMPLHMASSRSFTDMVRLLLEYGADPNSQDILLNTPLHLAACNSNLALIRLLIDAGADLRLLNMNHKNPIQIALSKLGILRQRLFCSTSGAQEITKIKSEVQEIVDLMIAVWANKTTKWGHHRTNVTDLEMMKLSLKECEQVQQIDSQMSKLLCELEAFSL